MAQSFFPEQSLPPNSPDERSYDDGYRDGWRSVLPKAVVPPSPPIPPSERMLYHAGYDRGRSDAIAVRPTRDKSIDLLPFVRAGTSRH